MKITKLYSYKELLQPIINILHLDICSTKNVKMCLRRYNELSHKLYQTRESKYLNIDNYTSYVYLITDKLHNKHYIGVRYTPNKLDEHSLNDLKQYSSSSQNKRFKYRLQKTPEQFDFTILKEFKTEFDAQNYEALLHQIFQVDTNKYFYNSRKENFKESLVFVTPLYDLQTDLMVYYKDIKEHVEYDNIWNLVSGVVKTYTHGRYCLLSNYNNIKVEYKKQHEIITLWTYNNDDVYPVSKTYNEWRQLIGNNFNTLLIKTTKKRVGKYFKTKEDCLAFVINDKIHTLYYHEVNPHRILSRSDTLFNWKQHLGNDVYHLIITKTVNVCKGFFYNYEICEQLLQYNHALLTLYVCYNTTNVYSITHTISEWSNIMGIPIYKIHQYIRYDRTIQDKYFCNKFACIKYSNRNRKMTLYTYNYVQRKVESTILTANKWKSVLGNDGFRYISQKYSTGEYYTSADKCQYDNLLYIILNKQTNEITMVRHIQAYSIIGREFYTLLQQGESSRFKILPNRIGLI